LIRSRKEVWKDINETIFWKLFYYSYILFLPILFNSASFAWILAGFFISHFITGLLISVVFQLAHVMPEMSFPKIDQKDSIDVNWYEHQLQSTSNFSPKSSWFSWFIGGLNYQIEHHLFPNISHVHYRNLSKIIAETAREYNLPYYVNKNFFGAVWLHLKMLRNVGRIRVSEL
ncbi:MAG: fatty acid desaturase, partial [Crocinitomicaceae bacterium]